VRNAFNAAKSDLKLLDYAAMGMPTLCSPVAAYQDLLDAGLALAAEPGQWADQIFWAFHHRRRLRRQARAIHQHLWENRNNDSLASQWSHILCSLPCLE
jgi:hypothetical protein